MILDTASKSIQVVLGETATTQCDVTAAYTDTTPAVQLSQSFDLVTDGTNPVTIVGPPHVNAQRMVSQVNVCNRDSVNHDIYLLLKSGGSLRYFASRLATPPGACFSYQFPPGEYLTPIASGRVHSP